MATSTATAARAALRAAANTRTSVSASPSAISRSCFATKTFSSLRTWTRPPLSITQFSEQHKPTNHRPMQVPCTAHTALRRAMHSRNQPQHAQHPYSLRQQTPSSGELSATGGSRPPPLEPSRGVAPETLRRNLTSGEVGKRGEVWVLGQTILFALVALPLDSILPSSLLPISLRLYDDFSLTSLPFLSGIFFLVTAAWLVRESVLDLGDSLTPFPKPVEDTSLKTSGVYGQVRHPMYASVVALATGYSLLIGSGSSLAFSALLLLFLDKKAGVEEKMLEEVYGEEYQEYKKRAKKLIPGVY